MICLVQFLYWEATSKSRKSEKGSFLKCKDCPLNRKCTEASEK